MSSSKIGKELRAQLDAITDGDECGYVPDAKITAEILIQYHGEAAENVLNEALDIARKYKKR